MEHLCSQVVTVGARAADPGLFAGLGQAEACKTSDMDRLQPLDAAKRVIAEHFPSATSAFLAGSVLTSRRTSTSDLDIVVVVAEPQAPYRETIRAHGWIVELFVHTRASLHHYWDRDALGWQCMLAGMLADGRVLHTTGREAADIRTEAQQRIDSGPPPVPAEELDRRRYLLTDLRDDLRGSTDETETAFIASKLFADAGELALLHGRHWIGDGKWLPRQLKDLPGDLAVALADGLRAVVLDGSVRPLDDAVTAVLLRAGGPITEGYRAQAEDPKRDHGDSRSLGPPDGIEPK